MKKLIISLVIAFLFINSANATSWEKSCLNNETLLKEINLTSGGRNSIINQTIPCPNGCEDNLDKYGADCVEPSYIITFWVIAGVIGMFFLLLIALGRRR